MKYTFSCSIILLLLIAGCNKPEKDSSSLIGNVKENDLDSKPDIFSLLEKYKDVPADTFVISDNYERPSGILLDSTELLLLFDSEKKENYLALFKFTIDSTRFGLITYCPEDMAAEILLQVLNTSTIEVSDENILAVSYGDNSFSWLAKSLIIRNHGSVTLLISESNCTYDEENDSEECSEVLKLFRCENGNVKTLALKSKEVNIDTMALNYSHIDSLFKKFENKNLIK